MTNEEKILEEANYYLNNDVTMKQTAEHFGVAKKTIQIHLTKKLKEISLENYVLVNDKKEANLKAGQIKGGSKKNCDIDPSKISARRKGKSKISDEQLQEITRYVLEGMSIRDISSSIRIPKSTIYENLNEERLGEELYSKVSDQFEINKATKGFNK